MKNMARHIVTGTLTLLVLWAASCSHDTEVFGTSDKEPILSIGLRLPARSPEPGEGYEAGETYENYIDIENNNYRIYFSPPTISSSPVLSRTVSWRPKEAITGITVCLARPLPLWPITRVSRWSCLPTGRNTATIR